MEVLNRTPFAQELRLTVDNWDPTKLKSVCAAKETFNEEETRRAKGNTFVSFTRGRRFTSKTQKKK